MNLTLSVDEAVVREARKTAEALGSSVNQLVREYLEHLAGATNADFEAKEFRRLSAESQGDSRGWKFNREEAHDRR